MAFIKKYTHQMTEEEKNRMRKWNQEDQRAWREWIRQNIYLRLERYAITHHQQPCNCLDCRVYRQRVRIRCQRPVKRKPR